MAVNEDYGTDPPLVDLSRTQATSPEVPSGVNNGVNANDDAAAQAGAAAAMRPVPSAADDDVAAQAAAAGVGATSPMNPGAGSNEDGGYKTANVQPTGSSIGTITGTFNNNSQRLITPRPNVLNNFSSYTYQASVYLMSPDQYTQLVTSKKKTINGYSLLFQSAGAPVGGRNPAFDVDFYIDSISINNLIIGKATGAAHSVSDLKFTVVEPNGITLVDRIYQAVQEFAPADASGKGINYGNSHYLMVIRWYGYDSEGNITKVGAADPTTGLTDSNAAIEKFIPFMINSINFTVASRGVTYEFDCTATNQIISVGTRRGSVPYDIQLSSTTVKDLLDGQSIFLSSRGNQADENQSNAETRRLAAANAAAIAQAPSKANAATQAKQVVTGGLMAALTQYQKTLTEGPRPIFDEYDEYYIEFTPRAKVIADARLVVPGNKQEAKTSDTKPTATSSADSANPKTDVKSNQTKTKSIYAGQPIVQVIDQVIRNSTFISEQQLTQLDSEGEEEPNPNARNKPVNWFSISFRAVPKKYDFLRNDYSYKITYVIDLYPLSKYDSKYFPISTYRGVHKVYPWWFTGQNTEVIEYSETLNTAFNMVVSGTTPETSAAEVQRRKVAASQRDLITYVYGPGSDETRQGADSKTFEGSANLADSLYGGADLAEAKLKILGDPAWIQQGSLIGGVSVEELENRSFLPDGTVNFDGEQPMFEVQWNRPSDYNLETGLQLPNSGKAQLAVSRVYQAATVLSEFRQGKFEQTITGLLFQLPKPDGSNKAPSAPMPSPESTVRQPTPEEAVTRARTTAPGTTVAVNGHLMTNTQGGAAILYRKSPMRAITVPTVPVVNANAPVDDVAAMSDIGLPPPAPTPETPPKPATSNGLIAAVNNFLPPSVGGRGRIQVPNNPQLLAKDE